MENESRSPTFHFPFQPYAIQEKFMRELYFTLENKKRGIFESPTGTGKSLSICCSALQWLRDYKKKVICDLENEVKILQQQLLTVTDEKDWLLAEYEKIQKSQTLTSLIHKLDKLKKYREKFDEMKVRVEKLKSSSDTNSRELYFHNTSKSKAINVGNKESEDLNDEDQDLILDDVDDDQENGSDHEDIAEEEENTTKIYISSRTHSQLSQFIGEIKRTIFKDDTRVVTMASRHHYCINPNVSKLKNINLINERCLDMQKSKSKSTSVAEDGKVTKKTKTKSCTGCPFYNQTNINKLKEIILCDIMDIEDLVKEAKKVKACPYYASKAALKDAEVVLVSHAWVAGEPGRLPEGSVLVVDEAHALSGALGGGGGGGVGGAALAACARALDAYRRRYQARLSPTRALALTRLLYLLQRLLRMLDKRTDDGKDSDGTIIFTPQDFLVQAEIDHLNLRETVEFCKTTKLARKLHGFSQRYKLHMLEESKTPNSSNDKKKTFENFLKSMSAKKTEAKSQEEEPTKQSELDSPTMSVQTEPETSAGTCLYGVVELLQNLMSPSECGRVVLRRATPSPPDTTTTTPATPALRYLLLDAARRLRDIVRPCRSVIMAGGTMEPVAEFVELLGGEGQAVGEEGGVRVVRCGHVVEARRVLALALRGGVAGAPLVLTHRVLAGGGEQAWAEVCGVVRGACARVAGGVVCFVSSYAHERRLHHQLSGAPVPAPAPTGTRRVFREPRCSADVDQVLSEYGAAVREGGALLISVVGGKLSEGLNFNDDLCRCVVVIGMPYPNIKSPELQEIMNYMDRRKGPGAGNAYYEGLCMKAVNQCIGRAVRHARDYACMLLVDARYSRPRTCRALPPFVQNSLITNCTFEKAMDHIAKFFDEHKSQNSNN